MDEVARAAGVGKGTLFRRFGDRSGLALALLDDGERELQEAVLRGPPPLGPGAPAQERLRAFLAAMLELLDEHRQLLVAAESGAPGARFRSAVYGGWHQHVSLLLAESRVASDPRLLAHLVLAPVAAELFDYLRGEQGVRLDDLRRALDELIARAGGPGT